MGRVLIVTGASRGIGAATAREAARQGYDVCINYLHSESAANAVVSDVITEGRAAIAVQADVAIEAQVSRLFQACDRKLGRLAALVNNAGILEHQSPLAKMSAARLQRVLATNVIGSFMCAREAVKRMAKSTGGSGGAIVNVSSMAARLGGPHEYIDYAASKGAIDTMTIGLAKEVAAEGIRVNAVRPGIIDTQIHASGGEPHRIARLRDTVPMKREGHVEEVAKAILWLISDSASYSTGAFLDVSGGR